jgi:hypothetical protein
MDDNFKIVYRLLRFLDESADWEEFPHERFKADCFDVTRPRWELLLAQLAKANYIDGLTVSGNYSIHVTRPRITYLQENSLMIKAANLAKGIVGTVL